MNQRLSLLNFDARWIIGMYRGADTFRDIIWGGKGHLDRDPNRNGMLLDIGQCAEPNEIDLCDGTEFHCDDRIAEREAADDDSDQVKVSSETHKSGKPRYHDRLKNILAQVMRMCSDNPDEADAIVDTIERAVKEARNSTTVISNDTFVRHKSDRGTTMFFVDAPRGRSSDDNRKGIPSGKKRRVHGGTGTPL